MKNNEIMRTNTTVKTNEENNVVMALHEVDFFKADKNLSENVAEYVRKDVERKAVNMEYKKKITELNNSIEGLENLKGSIFDDKIDEKRKEYETRIVNLVIERDEKLEKIGVYKFGDFENALKKSFTNVHPTDSDVIEHAIISYFKKWGLDVSNTYFLVDCISAIGGKKSYNRYVNTKGIKRLSISPTESVKNVLETTFEHMALIGIISAGQIPEIIVNNYGDEAKARKKAEAKARRKAARKAMKAAEKSAANK